MTCPNCNDEDATVHGLCRPCYSAGWRVCRYGHPPQIGRCKPCANARAKRWKARNTERVREANKRWVEGNKEKVRETQRQWYLAHKNIVHARRRAKYRADPFYNQRMYQRKKLRGISCRDSAPFAASLHRQDAPAAQAITGAV